MKFGEKLRRERTNMGLTQEELALKLGVTCRTLQNYESGMVYPKKRELYAILADFFGTDVNYWLTETQDSVAVEKSMYHSEIQGLATQVSKLFYDGDLTEDDMDDFMRTVQGAYWAVKDRSRHIEK